MTVRRTVRRSYIFHLARCRKLCLPSFRHFLSFGCRVRALNLLYYGLLGGRELLQRTYKNLDQRVRLEVRRINGFLFGTCYISGFYQMYLHCRYFRRLIELCLQVLFCSDHFSCLCQLRAFRRRFEL